MKPRHSLSFAALAVAAALLATPSSAITLDFDGLPASVGTLLPQPYTEDGFSVTVNTTLGIPELNYTNFLPSVGFSGNYLLGGNQRAEGPEFINLDIVPLTPGASFRFESIALLNLSSPGLTEEVVVTAFSGGFGGTELAPPEVFSLASGESGVYSASALSGQTIDALRIIFPSYATPDPGTQRNFALDSIVFGSVAAVPLPAGGLLLLTGLAGLALARRRV